MYGGDMVERAKSGAFIAAFAFARNLFSK